MLLCPEPHLETGLDLEQRVLAAGRERDVGAPGVQRPGHGGADAARSPGHHGDPVRRDPTSTRRLPSHSKVHENRDLVPKSLKC